MQVVCSLSFLDLQKNVRDIDNSAGTSDPDQITIPATGSGYNYNIYWKNVDDPTDNGIFLGNSGSTTISFPISPGTYKIEITGSFPRIYFNNSDDHRKILTNEQWGDIAWSSMADPVNSPVNINLNVGD